MNPAGLPAAAVGRATPPRPGRSRRAGFSLVELVVAAAVIGILAAAAAPVVVRQSREGDRARWHNDLRSVAEAIKLYRIDVRRWPASMGQLMTVPTTAQADLLGAAYTTGTARRWRGPYLESLVNAEEEGYRSARNAVIGESFRLVQMGEERYLQVQLANIAEAEARRLSHEIDGDTVIAVDSVAAERVAAGRIRFVAGAGPESGTLLFLAARVEP